MPRDSNSESNVIVTIIIIGAVITLGFPIFDGIASAGGADPVQRHTDVPVTTDEYSQIDTNGDVEKVLQVNDSTGTAVLLTGANDSYIESDDTIKVPSDGTWTIGTWAQVDSNGTAENETMTLASVEGEVLLHYNGSSSQWSAYYYNESSRNSYRVNVSAPNQPGNLTWVAAWSNGTHFTVYANTTRGEIVELAGENSAEAEWNASNWDGMVEELRILDKPLNATERSDHVSDPVAPLKGAGVSARLMFDEGDGTSTAVYFTGGSATVSNVTWGQGHPGNILTQGDDYAVGWFSDAIKALEGGRLDGAPVAWVTYRIVPQRLLGGVLDSLGDTMVLAGVVTVVLIASRILGTELFEGGGGRRRR